MSIDPKPGMILFYEPDDIGEIESAEQAAEIDTACVIIELGNGKLSYVPLRGAGTYKLEGDRELKGVIACRIDLATWHTSQAAANKGAFEREKAYHESCLASLENAAKFFNLKGESRSPHRNKEKEPAE